MRTLLSALLLVAVIVVANRDASIVVAQPKAAPVAVAP